MEAETPKTEGDRKPAGKVSRTARRRGLTRTVNEVREQLESGSTIKPAFDWELLVEHARLRRSASLWLGLLFGALGVVGLLWTDRFLLGAWLFMVLITHATSLIFAGRFLKLERQDVDLKAWRGRFAALDAAFGLALGLLFLLPDNGGLVSDVFQFSSMIVLVAVCAVLAANLPAALFSAVLPIAVITLVGYGTDPAFGFVPAPTPPVIFALMALVSQVFFVGLGLRLFRSSLAEIEARAEKDMLIVELEHANALSDESRRKAEEANFAKSRFLATMSHELRTPLNAILGFSEVMRDEIMGPIENDAYRGYVADIHDSGRHLLELINEILDISRIEAGRYTLNEESVTLPYIVEDCAHMIGLRARSKGLSIVEQYEDALPKIWADERALRQIVLNLLSNAVKFTPTGGTIWVKVGWTAGGGQYVAVKDTGPGIPEEEIPIVLSRFGQGSIAIKSAEQGTGLGLSIVQALIGMHGGTFDLRSKMREGTEVTVTIPQSRVLEVMPRIEERPGRKTGTGRR